MRWEITFVSDVAEEEVLSLPADLQAKFLHIGELIEQFGLPAVHEPYIKHLTEAFWEIRLRGKSGIARSIYITVSGPKLVILRTFIKKCQKTPAKELRIARARAEEMK